MRIAGEVYGHGLRQHLKRPDTGVEIDRAAAARVNLTIDFYNAITVESVLLAWRNRAAL